MSRRLIRGVVAMVALAMGAAGSVGLLRLFLGDPPPLRPMPRVRNPTPSPSVTTIVSVEGASSVVVGEDGVWVASTNEEDPCDQAIVRVDPATGELVGRVAVRALANWEVGGGGMAAVRGSVWVAGTGCEGSYRNRALLQRIDASTNRLSETIDLGTGLAADVAIAGSGIWVSVFRGTHSNRPEDDQTELVRIDPTTGHVLGKVELATDYVRDVRADEDSVWVAEGRTRGANVLGGTRARVDPGGNQVDVRVPNVGFPFALEEGVLWAERGCSLLSIDALTAEILHVHGFSGCPVLWMVEAGEGGVWFFSQRRDGIGPRKLVRFNPAHGGIDVMAVLEKDSPGLGPIDMAIGDGVIWVVGVDGVLARVDLYR